MGRIVVSEFVTLDGVMEDPGGAEGFAHGGWAFKFERGDEGDKFKLDEVMEADAMLLGRVTYEGFAAAWPERTRRGRIRRQDERDAQVRRLVHARRGDVEQLGCARAATWPTRRRS